MPDHFRSFRDCPNGKTHSYPRLMILLRIIGSKYHLACLRLYGLNLLLLPGTADGDPGCFRYGLTASIYALSALYLSLLILNPFAWPMLLCMMLFPSSRRGSSGGGGGTSGGYSGGGDCGGGGCGGE